MNKKTKNRCIIWIIVILLLIVPDYITAKQTNQEETKIDNGFSLTEQEKNYLSSIQNNTITIGVPNDSTFRITSNGEEIGTIVPFLNLLRKEFKLSVEVVKGDWSDSYQRLLAEEIDFLYGLTYDDDTEKFFYMAKPFYYVSIMLITNKENTNSDLKYLDDSVIGVIKDSGSAYYATPSLYSAKKIVEFSGTNALVEALRKREIDGAIVSDAAGEILFDSYDLKVINNFPYIKMENTVGTCKKQYYPLIDLFNRYLTETEEGIEFQQQIQLEGERYNVQIFSEKEEELIKKVRQEYSKIGYYSGNGTLLPLSYIEEEEKKGIAIHLIKYFEEVTGIEFYEKEKIKTLEQAKKALQENTIQLAIGINKTTNNKRLYQFSEPIYPTYFTAITNLEEEEVNQEDVLDYYWGVLESNVILLKNSIFYKNLIEFPDMDSLLLALKEKEIKGAIISQELVDYYDTTVQKKLYKQALQIEIPYTEYFAYTNVNTDLNELLDKLIYVYKTANPNYIAQWEQVKINYQEELVNQYLNKVILKNRFIIVLVIAAVLLAGTIVWILLAARKLNRMGIKVKTMIQSNPKLDMIEVDLGMKKISSSSGFSIFGLKNAKKEYSLKQLSSLLTFDFTEHYRELEQRQKQSFEIEYSVHKENRVYHIREIGNKTNQYLVSTLFDISNEKEENAMLRHRAEYDPMTGLCNRLSYANKICEIVEKYPEQLGVFAFMDIDQFKQVNDTYGHAIGDELLISFAKALLTLETNDARIAFRIAGDEFGFFCGNLSDETEILQIMDKLESLKFEVTYHGACVTTNYSCGVSIYNQDGSDLQTLMECADKAMYFCKKNKLSIVRYNKSMELFSEKEKNL